MAGKLLNMQPVVSIWGLVLVALGALTAYAVITETAPLEFVMWILGFIMLAAGIMFVVAPQLPRQIWDALVVKSPRNLIRALAGVGVVIGLFVLILGLTWLDRPEHPRVARQPAPPQEEMQPQNEAPPEREAAPVPDTAAMRERLDALDEQFAAGRERLEELQGRSDQQGEEMANMTNRLDEVDNRLSTIEEGLREVREALAEAARVRAAMEQQQPRLPERRAIAR